MAFDPEHKLVLKVVVGRRDNAATLELIKAVREKVPRLPRRRRRARAKAKARTRARRRKRVLLLATDGYLGYPTSVKRVFGSPPPPGLSYAVVRKHRDEQGRVVSVERRCVCGGQGKLERALAESAVSRVANTAFVERHNATDRHRNARKGRRTYRFSKDWRVHEAVTYFTYYTYNFCWCVRSLRQTNAKGIGRPRTPAMAAGLTGHVWTLRQWLQQVVVGLTG